MRSSVKPARTIPQTSIYVIAVLKREEEQATLGTLSGRETEPLPSNVFVLADSAEVEGYERKKAPRVEEGGCSWLRPARCGFAQTGDFAPRRGFLRGC